MNILLFVAIVAIIYLVWHNGRLASSLHLATNKTEDETSTEPPQPFIDKLKYEWYDTDWPYTDKAEVEKYGVKYTNPHPFSILDIYSSGLLHAEYQSAHSSLEKIAVLRRIRNSGVRVPLEIADLAFADEMPVRAWAAAHLDLIHNDFSGAKALGDYAKAPVIRNFETLAQTDPDPFVRASFYSNPGFKQLPWNMFKLVDNWQDLVASLTQLERLALMRNPDLEDHFLVALMQESSDRLKMTAEEHWRMICAGVLNPRIISGSRRTGRDAWFGFEDAFPPIQDYGKMWQLAVDRWNDKPVVGSFVFQHIQTTPEIKIETYNKLLTKSDRESAGLRETILWSCHVMLDAEILGAGLNDPEEKCRKAATETLGDKRDRAVKYVERRKKRRPKSK